MPLDLATSSLWRGWWRPVHGRWLLLAEHADEDECRRMLDEAKPNESGDVYVASPGKPDPNTWRKRR